MLRLITILRVRINSITTNCEALACLDSRRFFQENKLAFMLLTYEDTICSILQVFAF